MSSFRKVVEGGYGGVVILAGSGSDDKSKEEGKPSHIEKLASGLDSFGVSHEVRIASAHKQPEEVMAAIKHYDSLEGPLVYIAVAGGTDALSGLLSFHTYRPVISCPPDSRPPVHNESCLNNPPGSSNLYVARPDNAVRAAVQILSLCNRNEYRVKIRNQITDKVIGLEKDDERIRAKYEERQGR